MPLKKYYFNNNAVHKKRSFFPKNTATDVYSFPVFNTGYKLSRAWQQLHCPPHGTDNIFFFALRAGNQFSLRSTCGSIYMFSRACVGNISSYAWRW